MKTYENFNDVLTAIEQEDKEFQTMHLIELHNMIYTLSYEERLLLLQKFHEKIYEERKTDIEKLEELFQLAKEKESAEYIQKFEKLVKMEKENMAFIPSRLQRIKELQELCRNDEVFPFEKGKSYRLKQDNEGFMTGTGEAIGFLLSSKVKVLENSKFLNGFQSFILDPVAFWRSKSYTPHVLVKVNYGEYKGVHVYIRLTDLEEK